MIGHRQAAADIEVLVVTGSGNPWTMQDAKGQDISEDNQSRPDLVGIGTSLPGSSDLPVYAFFKITESKMNQNTNAHQPTFIEVDPSVDAQRPSEQIITNMPTAEQLSDVQGGRLSAPWTRAASIDYGHMEAVAWAADMYNICGGDGESNAYLGDGISITPDGRLVDD